jgi:hypothetical protein
MLLSSVERRCRLRGSPALLTGRLFDEQGHRMTATHTNKKGMRYSYYVSQAVLRKHSPGSIGRVPAPELEAVVVDAIRRHLQENGTNPIPETDRELIERHLPRMTLGTKAVMLHLRVAGQDGIFAAAETTIAFPWTVPTISPVKGIAYVPTHNTPMDAIAAGTARRGVGTSPASGASRWSASPVSLALMYADHRRSRLRARRYSWLSVVLQSGAGWSRPDFSPATEG